MSLNSTVTKKILERIVHETFSNLGFLSSSSLLDSLKLLGFYYATNAGISINIEDLKTPDLKKQYIETANEEINKISEEWAEGIVSDQERFQSIIDNWNIATESLKNKIVEYYRDFDPANNLYIMAFSGARGNMSQVRQLVGMRGLMSDQEGKIIDLPIQANFREGLSSIDYIVSSYGARKGIVDTALKTADSGYLTRRLIYLAQDLVIRELDCHTKKGILIFFKKNGSIKNLIGRQLISVKEGSFPFSSISKFSQQLEENKNQKNIILTEEILEDLKKISPTFLTVRSSLTCESKGSICQKCYGWDLAQQRLISLGETVGIIAAQSIGEPGTQLTMRTFHTGGIFTGETLKQLLAPFSGRLIIPESLKALSYRTNHGVEVLKLKQEIYLQLIDWKGIETNIFLEIGSYLYIKKTTFVYKNQLISEVLNQSINLPKRKLKPIYSRITGKVLCNVLPFYNPTQKGKTRTILLEQGVFWIASGKIFSLPIEAEYFFSENLQKEKAIARLKIITPREGIIQLTNSSISILPIHFGGKNNTFSTNSKDTKIDNFSSKNFFQQEKKVIINLLDIKQDFENCITKISPLVRNYQYVDKYTVLAFIYIFPKESSGKIISIEKKKTGLTNTFFIVTEKDVWKLYGPSRPSKFEISENNKVNESEKNDKNRSYSCLKNLYEVDFVPKNDFQTLTDVDFNFHSFPNIVTPSTFKDSLLKINHSGLALSQDGDFRSFQHLDAICLPINTIVNYTANDLVLEKKLFATVVTYSQQTDDIVQGLPKIEELIEARKPTIEACLTKRPGVILDIYLSESGLPFLNSKVEFLKINNGFSSPLSTVFAEEKQIKEKKTKEKNKVLIGNRFFYKNPLLIYRKKFYDVNYFSSSFKYDEYIGKFILKEDEEEQITKKEKVLPFSGKKYEWVQNILPVTLLNSLLNYMEDMKERKNIEKKDPNYKKKEINFLKEIDYEEEMEKISQNEHSDYLFYQTENEIEGYDFIFPLNEKVFMYLKQVSLPSIEYSFPAKSKILVEPGDFIDIGEPITEGLIDSHELLNILFSYHLELDGIIEGTRKSVHKFQLILANSIQSIYQAQGVNISSKHIEIIVRQMTSKVVIKTSGDTPFLAGELISLDFIKEMYEVFRMTPSYKTPLFEPKLLSATNSSLSKDGFLSAAGFQETRKILTKAAIEGNSDWLRGLKESIMSGRMIPAGSAFLNYKNYLDNLYFFQT